MTNIRIGTETHEQLKNLAREQGSTLTGLLTEIVSLLVMCKLSPAQLQAKLASVEQLDSFQKLLTEQVAKLTKVLGGQERNYLFPFARELALIKEHTEHLAAGQKEFMSLLDIDERLHHLEQLIQENSQALDRQYQLLMEV